MLYNCYIILLNYSKVNTQMNDNIDLIIRQTVLYNAQGYPVVLLDSAGLPYLMHDINGNRVVVADSKNVPLVIADVNGNLLTLFDVQTTPSQTFEEYQLQNMYSSQSVVKGNARLESEGASQPKPTRPIKRDEVYKKVKRLDVDSVKQFLLYESIIDGSFRFFINFDEADAYNLLIDKLIKLDDPIGKIDYLASLKTDISIPNSLLNWFSEDLRAGLYFASFIDLASFSNYFYGGVEFLYWMKSIIKVSILAMEEDGRISIKIDLLETLREENIKNLMIMKVNYLQNRTKYNQMDWFDERDDEQVHWGYNYLSERKIILFDSIFYAKTVSDDYNLVLASIDVLPNSIKEHTVPNGVNKLNFTRRELLVYKMHRAWNSILSTRKKTEQKSKRSITVNQSNYDKLLKLGTHHDLTTSNKVINKLITDEYDRITGKDNKELIDTRLTDIGHSKFNH